MAVAPRSTICTACGWVYDQVQGDPDGAIAPDTPWEAIPQEWICPVCGAAKAEFEPFAESAGTNTRKRTGAVPLVILGSGLAGYSLARKVRQRDAAIPIVLISADGGEVYSKPMLSNALARGHQPDDMVQMEAAALAQALSIEIRTRTWVTGIDRTSHRLTTQSGDISNTLEYNRLVLALGADARIFPVDGDDEIEIFTVNDLDDYRAWRTGIGRRGRILLIGAGLIGCEFANDLATGDFEVSLVDPAPWPLARLLPEKIGDMLSEALENAGCTLYMGRTVANYQQTGSGPLALLDDGTPVPFDHVLSAVGLQPRIRIAQAAGLEVRTGIITDRLLRTSDPHIYAVGDCAESAAGYLPFIAPLLAQTGALAATLTGAETPLRMAAMPIVVKTPALPLVVSPPKPGIEGEWEIDTGEDGAMAIYRLPDGSEAGFVLADGRTLLQREMTGRMPDLLPLPEAAAGESQQKQSGTNHGRYQCDICNYVYDPKVGDPDSGIAPGTPWEAVPDDWVCPVCGAGKAEFSPVT